MRIAHLELGRHLYGGAEQVRYLLDGLRDDRHQHTLVTPVDSALHDWARDEGQRCFAITFGGEHDLPFIWRLSRWLRSNRIELLHVHSRRGADWMGALAARQAGVPAILSRRVDNPPGRLLVRLMGRSYRRVICISDAIREVLQAHGVDETNLLTIRSAVDAARYQLAEVLPDARQQLVGDAPAGPVIAVIAQLIERKGHRFLIDGLPGLRERFPGLQAVFLGQGGLADELRAVVRSAGLQDCVHFAGFRDDLIALLPAIDVVVHPALMEGLGVSLLQVAAAGIPVVAFAAGGVREAVAHDHSGILVRTADSVSLAAAVGRLLGDPALARALGDNARRRVESDFSIRALVQRHDALYDVLAEERE